MARLIWLLATLLFFPSSAFAQTPWGIGGFLSLPPYGVAAGNTTEIRFYELVANGAQYVYWKAPDSIATTWGCVWPSAPGGANEFLKTDGANPCVLSWAAGVGTGTVTNTGALTANRFILGNAGVDVIAAASITGLVLGQGASAPTSYAGTTPCGAGDFIQSLDLNGVATCATPAGGGNVTAGGTLTSNALVLGAGGTAVAVVVSLGTTTTLLHGNAAGAPSFGAVSLTADVSGTLPVGSGGIGVGTLAIHGILIGNTTGAVNVTAVGATGEVLVGASGADPVWSATPTVTSLTAATLVTTGQAALGIGPHGAGAGNTGEIRFLELAAGGTNYRGFKAADALTDNLIWVLPTADGANGECLATDGAGTLSWGVCSAGAGTGITSLGGLTAAVQTFANDTNVTIASVTSTHTLGWTGTLAVARGGIGVGTLLANGVLLGQGTSPITALAVAPTGTVLTGVTASSPAFSATPTVTGLTTTGQAAHVFGPYGAAAGNTGEARFLELAANGVNYVAFRGADSIASNVTWTLPSADGSAGQCMTTSGAGVLSFAACATAQAPSDATYVTLSLNGTLTNERVLTAGTGIGLADAGAGSTITLSVAQGTAFAWTGAHTYNQQAAISLLPFGVGAGNTGEIRWRELAANGTNYVGFKAPNALAGNVIWTLPTADASGCLQSSGGGVLSISACPGAVGSVTGSGLVGQDTYWSGASTLAGESTIIHAKGHGLVSGGTANANTAAMNSAIAAFNAQADGASLLIPCGTFAINALNAFTKGGTVTGCGMGGSSGAGTIFVTTANPLFDVTGANGVIFERMKIQGGVIALRIQKVTNTNYGSRILDVIFDGCTTCVSLINAQNVTIARSNFLGVGFYGVRIETPESPDSSDIAIYDNFFHITGEGSTSIHWVSGGGVQVRGNRFLSSAGSSAHLNFTVANAVATSDILIVSNQFEGDADYAIYLDKAGTGTLSNVIIASNEFAGLDVNPIRINSVNVALVTITGNVLGGGPTGLTYMNIVGVSDAFIGGNAISGNGGSPSGITVGAAAVNVTVGDNHYKGLAFDVSTVSASTKITGRPVVTAVNLPATIADGSTMQCTNCTLTTNMGACAASGGTVGVIATRISGGWRCQ
jgi:hypothetical protein